jgi:FkbM family methyltransferase
MLSRLKRIHRIASYWAPVVDGHLSAYLFFARAKFGTATTGAHYKGIPFRFRSCDLSAVDETLIRGEYEFIVPYIAAAPSPLIVDVGMNVGDFSILAVAVNPASRIVGVEADAATAALASSNAPSRSQGTWTVHHRAAWKNNETIFLETGALSVSTKISATGRTPVQGIDLPTLWSQLPSRAVDVLKIDVEGAEEAFLCEHPGHLAHVNHLIVEIHPKACDEQRVRQVLHEAFPIVADVPGRVSSKPLLHCRRV